jgi:OmcA/MtrC family decaheme c-type cytochrome
MKTKLFMYVALCFVLVFTLGLMAGCKGSDGTIGAAGAVGATGATGVTGATGSNGAAGLNAGDASYNATITSVTTAQSGTSVTFTVNFSIKATNGTPIPGAGAANAGTPTRLNSIRIAYAKLVPAAANSGDSSVWVSYNQGERTTANLTDHGDGTYTYVCAPIAASVYDATATTRVGLQVSGITGYGFKNTVYDFVPDGSAVTVTRNVVTTAACAACHDTGALAHGSRYETKYCVVCHNPATSRNGHTVDFKSLIHEIHTSQTTSALDASGVKFPQDIRNCTTCHAAGDNWKTVPTKEACGSCHTTVNFATGSGHTGGIQADNASCHSCHSATAIDGYHRSNYVTTHNAGVSGAANFEYVITSVTLTTAGSQYKYPVVKFQIKNNGTPVNFSTGVTGTNLTGFTKGPSFGVAYAYNQDGVVNPTDLNVRGSSVSLTGLLNGTAGSISYDTAGTTATAVLSGSTTTAMAIPNAAKTVTAYMSGAFIQQNWSSISSDPTGSARPGIAAWKVVDGTTARRTIADAAKCNSCHEQLGTEPNFHGGSYNIVLCSLCHTPNQSSSGWTASYRAWVHGIHGASKRTVPYTWHAVSATENYSEVEYPGVLNHCEQCHNPGTYDYSASVYSSATKSMLLATTATGTFASTSYTKSPYIVADGVTNYGKGFSITIGADTNTAPTVVEAAATTLVSSPITAVCTACHDSSAAISHVKSNGGSFYEQRSDALLHPNSEACLICHGPGKVAAIADVHK